MPGSRLQRRRRGALEDRGEDAERPRDGPRTLSPEQPASTRPATRSGVRLRGLDRHVAAQREPDEHRTSGGHLGLDRRRDDGRGTLDREGLGRQRPMAGQVDGHAAVRCRESRRSCGSHWARVRRVPWMNTMAGAVVRSERRPAPGSSRVGRHVSGRTCGGGLVMIGRSGLQPRDAAADAVPRRPSATLAAPASARRDGHWSRLCARSRRACRGGSR